MFKQIQTRRLILRQLTLADREAFFAYRSLPEVYQYQGWAPKDISEADIFLKTNETLLPNVPDTWLQWAICLKSGLLAGDLGMHFSADGYQAEIGYTLSPCFQGNGYAGEAVEAALAYLFNELHKYRVTASVDPRNQSSIRLLEKLNFRLEAYYLESYPDSITYTDDLCYAMLLKEWLSRQRV